MPYDACAVKTYEGVFENNSEESSFTKVVIPFSSGLLLSMRRIALHLLRWHTHLSAVTSVREDGARCTRVIL